MPILTFFRLQNKLEKTIQYAPPDAKLNLEFRSSGIGKVGTELAVPFEVKNYLFRIKSNFVQVQFFIEFWINLN